MCPDQQNMETITVTVLLKMDIKNLINDDENNNELNKATKQQQIEEVEHSDSSSADENSNSLSPLRPRSSPSILDQIHESPKVLSTIMKTRKKGIYKCTHCAMHFTNFLDLAKHYDDNDIKREFHCPEEDCPWHVLGLPNRNELNRHIKSQHQPRQFSCRLGCDYKFHRADTRNRHEKQVHLNENSRLNKSQRNKKLKKERIMSSMRVRSNSDFEVMTHHQLQESAYQQLPQQQQQQQLQPHHQQQRSFSMEHHRERDLYHLQPHFSPQQQYQLYPQFTSPPSSGNEKYEIRRAASVPMLPQIQMPQFAIVYPQLVPVASLQPAPQLHIPVFQTMGTANHLPPSNTVMTSPELVAHTFSSPTPSQSQQRQPYRGNNQQPQQQPSPRWYGFYSPQR